MLTYGDLNPAKKAFIFELDNVLFPERDYLLQVYYLFANFIEFTETVPTGIELTNFLKNVYENHGANAIFDKSKEVFNLDEKYRKNFDLLHYTARLPLKLIMYENMLSLLQQIVVDRKQLFLITNGNPEVQLNKIRQAEWHGLDKYLTVYFADEIKPKPESDVFDFVIDKHGLSRKDVLIVGANATDETFAENSGADYLPVSDFL
ncbi:MAG: haloacid dehalogenase [Sphingobacteriales bacterium]|nr:haloacid dehalogenase [Sphingobacteriales bacterium]